LAKANCNTLKKKKEKTAFVFVLPSALADGIKNKNVARALVPLNLTVHISYLFLGNSPKPK